jgi:hypothetical protein
MGARWALTCVQRVSVLLRLEPAFQAAVAITSFLHGKIMPVLIAPVQVPGRGSYCGMVKGCCS